MKDPLGRWLGLLGRGLVRRELERGRKRAQSWADLLKPEYANQVALNGSPLSSGSAVAGVFSAALANGGTLSNVGPGINFFARLKAAGNFVPVAATPQTIASGQTPIVIDWDYLNLAYIRSSRRRRSRSLSRRRASTAPSTRKRSPATRTRGRRGSGRNSSTRTSAAPVAQGLLVSARFTDMARRKVVPGALVRALPAPAAYAKVRFASPTQNDRAAKLIAKEWPKKVGA